MAAHSAHQVHPNSALSYEQLDLAARAKLVAQAYQRSPIPMTDRQVVAWLGFDDMNCCRPIITNLLDEGVLVESDRVQCATTKKMVRRSRWVPPADRKPRERVSRLDRMKRRAAMAIEALDAGDTELVRKNLERILAI